MKILVNGREAVLKANASFEYVSENPLFTEAEDYTMEIPFPMKDCPQNISIFGPLHVKGVDISKVSFPCEIQTDAFGKSGILTITSVSDTEVKGQFLEGMSQQNFASSLPDVYLTDLDFSQWDGTKGGWSYDYVAEKFTPGSGSEYGWDEILVWDKAKEKFVEPIVDDMYTNTYISRRIYLHHLITLVAQAIGWSVDMSGLLLIPMFKNILVVNARHHREIYRSKETIIPLNQSLPHWTIKEFLQQISLFFGCFYILDEASKVIVFRACADISSSASERFVSLQVLDNFDIEVSNDVKEQFRGNQKLKFPSECNPKNLNSCRFIFEDKRIPFDSINTSNLISEVHYAAHAHLYEDGITSEKRGADPAVLLYLKDIDKWAVVSNNQDEYIWTSNEEGSLPDVRFQRVEIINQYDNPPEGTELKIAPCPMDAHETVKYPGDYAMAFVNPYKYVPEIDIPADPEESYDPEAGTLYLPPVVDYLSAGERKIEDMMYDKLWIVIAQNTGRNIFLNTRQYEPKINYTTIIDETGTTEVGARNLILDDEGNIKVWSYFSGFDKYDYTLSPQEPTIQANASLPKVDETKLYRYKFLAKTLPSPTSVFLIKGKRYACLKLTAQITVKGMSELVEGEFYEIID